MVFVPSAAHRRRGTRAVRTVTCPRSILSGRRLVVGDLVRLRWECPTCLIDYSEPFCSSCGADLNDKPTDVQAGLDAEDNFSRKVPGTMTREDIRRVANERGIHAATMLVGLDAVYAALKPGKASLR